MNEAQEKTGFSPNFMHEDVHGNKTGLIGAGIGGCECMNEDGDLVIADRVYIPNRLYVTSKSKDLPKPIDGQQIFSLKEGLEIGGSYDTLREEWGGGGVISV